jgi:hypothetical protein
MEVLALPYEKTDDCPQSDFVIHLAAQVLINQLLDSGVI